MTEPKDKARWDMCEQCLTTPGGSFGDNYIKLTTNSKIIGFIKCNREKEWFNPVRAYSGPPINRDPTYLCSACWFRMEHLILSQGKLDSD